MDWLDIKTFIESQKQRLAEDKNVVEKRKSSPRVHWTNDWTLSGEQPTRDTDEVPEETMYNVTDTTENSSVVVPEKSLLSPWADSVVQESTSDLGSLNQSNDSLTTPTVTKNEPCLEKQEVKRNISQSKSPDRDRHKEIELLQEKFSSTSFWDNFGSSATSKQWLPESVEDIMVRVGEFSPANPHLHSQGGALLGLGEYEERRRQLLEKKKQEYKEYLSQTRNVLHRTDHVPTVIIGETTSKKEPLNQNFNTNANYGFNSVHVATQTDPWLVRPMLDDLGPLAAAKAVPNTNAIFGTDVVQSQAAQTMLSTPEPLLQPLSPRVPRAHISQTTEQLPDARLRQVQHREELRLQIEEKRRREVERLEREKSEEEALMRRVAEQQLKLQEEFEKEEQTRLERELQKQQQVEEFQRRQEELRIEAEQIKQEERRRKHEAALVHQQQELHNCNVVKERKNARLVPHAEPAPIAILKTVSSPPRSPRRAVTAAPACVDVCVATSPLPEQLPRPEEDEYVDHPSPRALIKVLEGPTGLYRNLDDSLPIPLMPVAHSYAPGRSRQSPNRSPNRSPYRSPNRSPHRSPQRSPSRSNPHRHSPVLPALRNSRSNSSSARQPSEAMRNLEERWKVPAVQKNSVRCKGDTQDNGNSVLTQLGAFRRQLQMEHMRMQEKMKEDEKHRSYNQMQFEQPQHRHASS